MGKKVRKYKNVEIVLEPDGFSIHTIEFSSKVSQTEWRQIKSALYDYNEQYSENIIHPDGLYHGCHICTQYAEAGIRIRLEHSNVTTTETHISLRSRASGQVSALLMLCCAVTMGKEKSYPLDTQRKL